MKEFHGRAAARLDAPRDEVFKAITDIVGLATWNEAIEETVENPPSLTKGAEWTVRMHPRRMPSWFSISRLEELDPTGGRFAYETRNADGNPSHVKWAWKVMPAGEGSNVTVTWDCYLKTLDRKLMAGPLRRRQLAREVPRSLTALGAALASPR